MNRFGCLPSELSAGTLLLGGGVAMTIYLTTMLLSNQSRSNKKRRLPPQPQGMPIVGNLFQVFGAKPFLTFSTWAREHGDVFRLQLGGQPAVVLNSIQAAKQALVTNAKQLSGRPDFYTMRTIHENERQFVFAFHADDMLKLYRKTVLADTRRRAPDLEPIVQGEIEKMESFLFAGGEKEVTVDLRHLIHKVAVNIAHGYAMGSTFALDDARSETWSDVLDEYRELLHWFRVENFLPLSHVFLKGYKEKVQAFHTKANQVFMEGIEKARARKELREQEEKNGKHEFEANEEEKNDDEQVHEEGIGLIDTILEMFDGCKEPMNNPNQDAIAILRDVMFGCADGSYQPLTWALLFLCNHQDKLSKLQTQIRDVLGTDKMPELTDRDSLPYVEACIREVMRLSEITTLGIPRRTTEDVKIGDFDVPKDTLTIVNVYNIHRDPAQWEHPEEFNPDRFFSDSDNQELRPMNELSYLPFSTGNRSCPGQNLARGFIFLLFTRFFQKFDVAKSDEEVMVEDINAGGGFNPEVKPFKVRMSLRC